MTVTHAENQSPRVAASPQLSTGWLAGLGATVGFGALISSSCCALPIALAALGASGVVFSGLEFLVEWRSILLGAAAVVLLSAWALFFRKRAAACSTDGSCSTNAPSHRTVIILSVGTLFLALALSWDSLIEPTFLKIVR